jgi:hypothetical protein
LVSTTSTLTAPRPLHRATTDPNVKSLIEDLVKKICEEFREGFTVHEVIINSRLDDFSVADKRREEHVATLEEAAAAFDKLFGSWKPEVEASLTTVKLELSKLNSFFARDASSTSQPSPGVLPVGSTATRQLIGPDADGPSGHCVDIFHQDCGFVRVNTQTHDPIKGMIPPSRHSAQTPVYNHSLLGSAPMNSFASINPSAKSPMGPLPKIYFSKFDGDNLKLWQPRCEISFYMYSVEPHIWVRVATMHFEGAAARWLQLVERHNKSASWNEVCSWIHERFIRDQHESLIRQLFHIKQTSIVQNYIDRFTALVDQLVAYEHSSDHCYYTTRFIDGLKGEIKTVILVQRPVDLDTACSLALL